jgi:hypothetical protein
MPGFHGCPERIELIFDARTYELTGISYLNAKGKTADEGDTALLGTGAVSKPGQLP